MFKKIFTILFTVSAFCTLLAQEATISLAAADSLLEEDYEFRDRPNIAVLPFYDANAQAKEVEFGRTVSAMLATAMRSNTNFIVLERSELTQIITEQSIGISGLTRDETRSFKTLYDIDVILTGDVSLINSTLHIDARLIETTSSKIVVALYSTCQDLKRMRAVVEELAMQLEQSYLRQWMGSISINSQPGGAEVYLDDKFIGITTEEAPLQIENMLEGKYQLKFIRGGYYDWEGEISVLAKMDRSVKVSLIAKPGSMNIYSEPDGAEIHVDNNFMGVTPMSLKKVAEGEHEIRLVKKNFKEWTQRVLVRSFQPTDVKATLEVSPGILSVNSFPSGASIYFKGKFIAKTPHTMSNIPPGEIVLQVEKEGYESWTTSVWIAPSSQEVLNISLIEKKGMFTVSSKPDSAAVYLIRPDDPDKRFIGYAPITNYPVTIGAYIVEVSRDNYFSRQQKIVVRHNQLSDVGIELEEKPGSVLVSTNPQNVRVFLDGQFKGRSPLRLKAIPKGEYDIRLSLPFADDQESISVNPNQEAVINRTFKKSRDYIIPMTAIGAIILGLHLLTN
jgi:TolB-like protein